MSERPRGLKIDTSSVEGGQIVRLAGEIDLRTSPRLRTLLLKLIDKKPRRLILDLARVGYMDSSGVGTLVEVKRLVERRGGRVVLASLQPRVRSVFEISQLDRFFAIVDSVDEAAER